MDYTKLQNGSDIRGVAMEGIEGQHVNLTEQACRDIGRGFALWLRARLGKDTLRVAVGRDSRLSGPQLALWLMEAMAAEGLQVTDLGMASTPAMFMSTVTEGFAFDASVMITASHLPFNRNGYKFFTKDGGLEKQDIAAILALAGGSEHTGRSHLPPRRHSSRATASDHTAGPPLSHTAAALLPHFHRNPEVHPAHLFSR